MGAYCCRDDHEVANEQVDGCNQNNNGITYPCIKQEPFQTRAPCWHGHRCNCPCHRGTGPCIFKLKSK